PTRVSMRSPRESPRNRVENNLLPTYDALLERFMPQGFLVSDQRVLLECFNGSEALLRVPSRRLSTDFLDLVPEEVRLAVSGVLARAARESGPVGYASIEWPAAAGTKHFALTAERLNAKNAEAAFLMTVAEHDAPKRSQAAVSEMPMGSERVLTLEDELTRTRENL